MSAMSMSPTTMSMTNSSRDIGLATIRHSIAEGEARQADRAAIPGALARQACQEIRPSSPTSRHVLLEVLKVFVVFLNDGQQPLRTPGLARFSLRRPLNQQTSHRLFVPGD